MRRSGTFLLQLLYAVNTANNCPLPQIAKDVVVEIADTFQDLYNHRVAEAWKGSQEVILS